MSSSRTKANLEPKTIGTREGRMREAKIKALRRTSASHDKRNPEQKNSRASRKVYKREFEVEKILGKKIKRGKTFYLVKWRFYSKKESTWEPEEFLSNAPKKIQLYEETLEQEKEATPTEKPSQEKKRSRGEKRIFRRNTNESENKMNEKDVNLIRLKVEEDEENFKSKGNGGKPRLIIGAIRITTDGHNQNTKRRNGKGSREESIENEDQLRIELEKLKQLREMQLKVIKDIAKNMPNSKRNYLANNDISQDEEIIHSQGMKKIKPNPREDSLEEESIAASNLKLHLMNFLNAEHNKERGGQTKMENDISSQYLSSSLRSDFMSSIHLRERNYDNKVYDLGFLKCASSIDSNHFDSTSKLSDHNTGDQTPVKQCNLTLKNNTQCELSGIDPITMPLENKLGEEINMIDECLNLKETSDDPNTKKEFTNQEHIMETEPQEEKKDRKEGFEEIRIVTQEKEVLINDSNLENQVIDQKDQSTMEEQKEVIPHIVKKKNKGGRPRKKPLNQIPSLTPEQTNLEKHIELKNELLKVLTVNSNLKTDYKVSNIQDMLATRYDPMLERKLCFQTPEKKVKSNFPESLTQEDIVLKNYSLIEDSSKNVDSSIVLKNTVFSIQDHQFDPDNFDIQSPKSIDSFSLPNDNLDLLDEMSPEKKLKDLEMPGSLELGDIPSRVLAAKPIEEENDLELFVSWRRRSDGILPAKSKVMRANLVSQGHSMLLIEYYERKMKLDSIPGFESKDLPKHYIKM